MCSFVATPAEFRKQGCPNCEDKLEVCLHLFQSGERQARSDDHLALQMRGDQDQVMNCTTAQFDGVIAMIRPEESWVVRPCFLLKLQPSFDRARSPP